MSPNYHYLSPEDSFEWAEPPEDKDGDINLGQLFEPEMAESRVADAEPITRYLRSHVEDASIDIQQLRDEIVSRRRLMDRQIQELDYQVSRASWSLKQLDFRVGYNAAVDFKRNWTERELANFRRDRRNLRIRCWEDIVSLRKELREATKQYRDAMARRQLMERDSDGS